MLFASALACEASPEPANSSEDDSVEDEDLDKEIDNSDSDDEAPQPTTRRDGGTSTTNRRVDAATSSGGSSVDAGARMDARVSIADASAGSDARTPSDDAGEGPTQSGPKPKCMKKDSQLIIIGDSYINWPLTHSFPEDMAAASGQRWRMHAVGGYSMATGGTGLIPPTFDSAIRMDADAHTVLMDGGGNDLLLGDVARQCRDDKAPTIAACKKIITDALAAAEKLMKRMGDAGIRDVIYFFYPHVPKNTALGGPDPNHMLDYALPMVRDFCESASTLTDGKLRCTFVDMVPVFDGKPESQWFFPGDIHPTSVGSKAMAQEIWKVMTEKCIAQKGPKDCCE